MPLVTFNQALAAGATLDALQGSQWEFLPWPAIVRVGLLASATGVVATVSSGSDILMEEGPVQLGTINTLPVFPDDYVLEDGAGAGERIKIRLRNTTAGAIQVMGGVQITAVSL